MTLEEISLSVLEEILKMQVVNYVLEWAEGSTMTAKITFLDGISANEIMELLWVPIVLGR